MSGSIINQTEDVIASLARLKSRTQAIECLGVASFRVSTAIQLAMPEMCVGMNPELIKQAFAAVDRDKGKSHTAVRVVNRACAILTSLKFAFELVHEEVTKAVNEQYIRWTAKRIKPHTNRLAEEIIALKANIDEQQGADRKSSDEDPAITAMRMALVDAASQALADALRNVDELDRQLKTLGQNQAKVVAELLSAQDAVRSVEEEVRTCRDEANTLDVDEKTAKVEVDKAEVQYQAAVHQKAANIQDIIKEFTKIQKNFLAREEQTVAEHDSKVAEVTNEVHNTRRRYQELRKQSSTAGVYADGCHWVLVFDRSWSMNGSAFEGVKRATQAFKAAPVQGNHTVSLLAFDDDCVIITRECPFDKFVPEEICKFPPRGGTRYAPVWDQISSVVQSGHPSKRPVILFMTDGQAPDVDVAGKKAEKLFSAQGGNLVTFIIPLGSGVSGPFLDPIMLGGNGGQRSMTTARGTVIQFLVPANVESIPTAFSTVAVQSAQNHQEMLEELREYEQRQNETLDSAFRKRLDKSKATWDRQLQQKNAILQAVTDSDDRVVQEQLTVLTQAKQSQEAIKRRKDELNKKLEEINKRLQTTRLQEKSCVSSASEEGEQGAGHQQKMDGLIQARKHATDTLNGIRNKHMSSGSLTNEAHRMAMHSLFMLYSGRLANERLILSMCADQFLAMYRWVCTIVSDLEESVENHMTVTEKVVRILQFYGSSNGKVSVCPHNRCRSLKVILTQIAMDSGLNGTNVDEGISLMTELFEMEQLIEPVSDLADDNEISKARWLDSLSTSLQMRISGADHEVMCAKNNVRVTEQALTRANALYRKSRDDGDDDEPQRLEDKIVADGECSVAKEALKKALEPYDWAQRLVRVVTSRLKQVLTQEVIRQELLQMRKRVEHYRRIIDGFIDPLISAAERAHGALTNQANHISSKSWKTMLPEEERQLMDDTELS